MFQGTVMNCLKYTSEEFNYVYIIITSVVPLNLLAFLEVAVRDPIAPFVTYN